MRPEKQFLVDEVNNHLEKSDYLFLADYERANVVDIAELRGQLVKEDAEFHVIKNNILKVAAKGRGLPALDDQLTGQNAIIIGGGNPSGVAKILTKYFDKAEKFEVKEGMLSSKRLEQTEVQALAKLPSLDALRAQLLGLLSKPAQQMVFVINAVPQNILNVLQAKADAKDDN